MSKKTYRILGCRTHGLEREPKLEGDHPPWCSEEECWCGCGRMQKRSPVILFLQGCFRGKIVLYCESMGARHLPEYLRGWNMRPSDFTWYLVARRAEVTTSS